ncbi:MAG: hypothetical protein ABIA62_05440 [Candidatus Woesearchaeota archaeon]
MNNRNVRNMRNRKAQMEIMGLMIVVILLIIGVLFALKFVVLKPQPETRQSFTRTQMASNMGLALMSSSTENCRGTSIKDLLIDCAEWPENGGTITCDDGRKSCEYVNGTIDYIFNATLNTWNVKYYFVAGTTKNIEDQIVNVHNKGCSAENPGPGESESFFLPSSRGLLSLKIFICQ